MDGPQILPGLLICAQIRFADISQCRAVVAGPGNHGWPLHAGLFRVLTETGLHLLRNTSECRYVHVSLDGLLLVTGALQIPQKALALSSLVTSVAVASMSTRCQAEIQMQSQLFAFPGVSAAVDMICHHQRATESRILSTCCQDRLVRSGSDLETAARIAASLEPSEQKELIRQDEVLWEELPLWVIRGAGIYHDSDISGGAVLDLELPQEPDDLEFVRAAVRKQRTSAREV